MNDTEQSSSESQMNRYEKREQRRQEQKQEIGRAKRSKTFRRIVIWGATLAFLIGLVVVIAKLPVDVVPSTGGSLAVPVSESDNIIGSASAQITLVEYSDFQCPACRAFDPVVKQLLAETQGKVRLAYRNFPLPQHPNAQIAAQAAQAAALQGKFWQMHDKLFAGQDLWANQSSAGAKGTFTSYAQSIGLDTAKFNADFDSAAVKDKIKADQDGGNAAGIDATPTFFINGVKMPQPESYDQFKNFVINGVPTPTP